MGTTTPSSTVSIRGEFASAKFGDARLSARLVMMAESIAARPEQSLPHALATEKELDAGYRFLNNAAVSEAKILEPHRAQTALRMKEEKLVIVAHDTTNLVFGGRRQGLGRVSGPGNGFLLHASLAMTADGQRRPLGVICSTSWARAETPRNKTAARKNVSGSAYAKLTDRESLRWGEHVDAVAKRIEGATQVIHVMDREADSYELFAKLVGGEHRFVVRSCHDRAAREAEGGGDEWEHLRVVERRATVFAERDVMLSRRAASAIPAITKTFAPREPRVATLEISAMVVELRCPKYLRSKLGEALTLNLVSVSEPNPPDGLEPITWSLLTTESIDTADEVLAVVDHYRGRWLIEEYFKALKTGCEVEKLQLESFTALRNAVSLYLPIAADILRLRNLAEREPAAPAERIVSSTQLAVLRSIGALPLPPRPTIADVHLAIAMLGGYQRHKQRPGWLVLARGWQDLLMYERGWVAREKSRGDVGDP